MPPTFPTCSGFWVACCSAVYFAAAGIHHFSAIEPLTQAMAARGVPPRERCC